MLEMIAWSLLLFVPPVAFVAAILVAARVWQRHERRVLAFGMVLALVTLMSGCFAIGSIGGDDARLIIRNESMWPIEVSAEQPGGTQVVPPGESTELVGYGGPGWANGLIISPEIRGGPDHTVVLALTGLTGEELTIVVTNDDLLAAAVGGSE